MSVTFRHNPIFLRLGGLPQTRGLRFFRFEAAWIFHDGYSQIVEGAWNQKKNKPLEALAQVKEDSIRFNQEVFGNIFKRKKNIETRLQGIQRTLENVDSVALVNLEQKVHHEYNQILFQ